MTALIEMFALFECNGQLFIAPVQCAACSSAVCASCAAKHEADKHTDKPFPPYTDRKGKIREYHRHEHYDETCKDCIKLRNKTCLHAARKWGKAFGKVIDDKDKILQISCAVPHYKQNVLYALKEARTAASDTSHS